MVRAGIGVSLTGRNGACRLPWTSSVASRGVRPRSLAAATGVVNEAAPAAERHRDPQVACADATRARPMPSFAVGGARRVDDGVACPWAREPPEARMALMPAEF